VSGGIHHEDAGAYVLGALTEQEHADFVAHLRTCEACQREVAELKIAADALPLAAPQLTPPPDLRERILTVVRDEAEPERAAAPAPARRPWWRRPLAGLGPAGATALACVLLALGVGAGVLLTRDNGVTTSPAKVTLAGAPNATAELRRDDDGTRLRVRGFPSPGANRVYEVWLQRGKATPVPAGTLFRPGRDGTAEVRVGGDLEGIANVLVSREPPGGSPAPTSAPVVVAAVA
jgi:anti-sigma-K factor RskA